MASVCVAGGCDVAKELLYPVEHEKILKSLVEDQATEEVVIERLELGAADWVETPEDRELTPEGMMSAWAISEELANSIHAKIGRHGKTLIYTRTMVDFIYLDDGIVVDYDSFHN